jgi:hypothetical protein
LRREAGRYADARTNEKACGSRGGAHDAVHPASRSAPLTNGGEMAWREQPLCQQRRTIFDGYGRGASESGVAAMEGLLATPRFGDLINSAFSMR